jgi:hypothetical protein
MDVKEHLSLPISLTASCRLPRDSCVPISKLHTFPIRALAQAAFCWLTLVITGPPVDAQLPQLDLFLPFCLFYLELSFLDFEREEWIAHISVVVYSRPRFIPCVHNVLFQAPRELPDSKKSRRTQ